MAVLAITSALALRPLCELAIDWTNAGDDWPMNAGKEHEEHPYKQERNY
jgi:hypothetical protein